MSAVAIILLTTWAGVSVTPSHAAPGDRLAQPAAAAAPCPESLNVGYRVMRFGPGPKAALWYPTLAAEQRFAYARDTTSQLAPNAPPAGCGRFPLVLFSHGLGGCGTQSLFITESLARRGYIVVAPDHADARCSVDGSAPGRFGRMPKFAQPATWNDGSHANRWRDLQALLDRMLADPAWSRHIDAARIGIVGHSLGGYTALGMAGAWPTWKDTRLRAAVLLSPYVAPFQVQQTLGGVRDVALMYQGAQFDLFITPSLEGPRGAYASAQPPKSYVKLRLGSHFEWTNLLCVGTDTVSNCLQQRSNAALIDTYTSAFFDFHLKGLPERLQALRGDGLASYLQRMR